LETDVSSTILEVVEVEINAVAFNNNNNKGMVEDTNKEVVFNNNNNNKEEVVEETNGNNNKEEEEGKITILQNSHRKWWSISIQTNQNGIDGPFRVMVLIRT
jgi:hypothetical protein